MPNLVPHDMNEWMRRQEMRIQDLVNRRSDLIPVRLKDNTNLNDFHYPGRYIRYPTTGNTTALGYPTNGASGTLDVVRVPGDQRVHQIFFNRVNGNVYQRWYEPTSWGAWTS